MERTFPRVELPGVDRDDAQNLADQIEESQKLRFLFSRAMLTLGKHSYRGTVTGDTRKARRAAGKRQRAGRRATR